MQRFSFLIFKRMVFFTPLNHGLNKTSWVVNAPKIKYPDGKKSDEIVILHLPNSI